MQEARSTSCLSDNVKTVKVSQTDSVTALPNYEQLISGPRHL